MKLFLPSLTAAAAAAALLVACGGGNGSDAPGVEAAEADVADAATLAQVQQLMAPLAAPAAADRFPGVTQTLLVANKPEYGAAIVEPALRNPWGIAIRPAGQGGHFWIGAERTAQSIEYVGDVGGVPLFQDDLKTVATSGPVTGVAFNPGTQFEITQPHENGPITNPAKFFFANASGTISAWTERALEGGGFDRPADSVIVVDGAERHASFLGVTVSADGQRLFAADFGAEPALRVYDAGFAEQAPLANPFRNPNSATPFEAFNVQTLGEHVYATYGRHAAPGSPLIPEGRMAEFDGAGKLVSRWLGRGLLNYPWGVAKAPDDFGVYGGCLLVGNFGDGTIVAFHPRLKVALDYVRDAKGERIVIDGLWGLQFGNGASLGEANHLYFAAGPNHEEDGLFGKLQAAPSSRSLCR